jgi:hypothetical protein
MVQRIDFPFCARLRKTETTVCDMCESNPEVGSSQNMMEGFVRISDANESRFFSPPEIPLMRPGVPMTVSAHFESPSWNWLKIHSFRKKYLIFKPTSFITSLTRWIRSP